MVEMIPQKELFYSNYGKRTLLTNETLLIPIIYLKLFYSLLKVSLKGDNNASHEAFWACQL